MTLVLVLLSFAAVAAFSAYVRLAPEETANWHRLPDALEEGDSAGTATRIIAGDVGTLAQIDAIARATPRTRVLAGSVEAGMITYVTRSAVMGFPDYTTIALRDGQVVLYARLRFGQSDLGVNARRLDAWVATLRS